MIEESTEQVQDLHEKLDKLTWEKNQEKQNSGHGFGSLYSSVCDRIRAHNLLDSVMEEFEKCDNDLSRISYVFKLPEIEALEIQPITSTKSNDEAQTYEDLYDMLVMEEMNASRALEVIQRSIGKTTPSDNGNSFARRYMKRGWASLLLENFQDAYIDAKKSLCQAASPGLLWNAHEIIGHCHAKMKEYKQSEVHFLKALDGLRKSGVSNEEKAAVAGRVSTVLRMVKEENKPKNKAKETTRKQQLEKEKKLKKKNNTKEIEPEEDSVMNHKSNVPQLPKISFGGNSKLQNGSAGINVVVKEGRGRCVVASRDIKTGSILMIDQPFASVVNSDQLHLRCSFCCQRTSSGVFCDNCAVVQYCSADCSAKGAALHKLECSVMNQIYDPALGKMGPLVFRILDAASWSSLKRRKDKLVSEHKKEDEIEISPPIESTVEGAEILQKWQWDGTYSPKDYLTTFYLVSNSSKRSFGDLFKRSLSAVYICYCLKAAGYFGSHKTTNEDLQWISSLALRHIQNCSCNAYEISEAQINASSNTPGGQSLEIGGAVYSTISLTNHSCFPNVTRYNIGNSCVLRATRFIPKGSEILDNYGYYFHSMPSIERRDVLRVQYKFECECEPCEQNWPLYPHKHGEPIVFKCPGCKIECSYMEGTRTTCKECGDTEHYSKLVKEISSNLDSYAQILSLMHDHKYENALKMLMQLQEFFEPHACYPAKCFTDVQELIRQCFNCLGNVYIK